MHEYRITKYDPKYRVNGAYTRDEWTGIADIGRSFGGQVLTTADYEQAEQQHIDFLCTLAEREDAFPLNICGLEAHGARTSWFEGQSISSSELPVLARDVLREEVWCRLESKGFFIHFGYDYYMYVGCSFTPEGITTLAHEHHLHAEPMASPYHESAEDAAFSVDLRPMTAIYLTRGDKILLLYRTGSRVVANSYTGAAGGHMEAEEYRDPQACVLRELEEETGLTSEALEGLAMRYITMRLKNGEIRQNYYFFAELRDGYEPSGSNEGCLKWFSLDQLSALPMPHTAKQVLQHYVREGRFTSRLYGAISQQDGAAFTPLLEF